jgi:SAM-dependent methyltransferase
MKRILNVGCGRDTYGTDFIDIYPVRSDVIKCNVDEEEFPYKENTFDEVYAKFIFEHLKNPNNFLRRVYRVLKKGGKLILITDNAGCWVFHFPLKFLYSKQHYENSIREGLLDRHYALYTPLHLKNHLEAVGFKRIKTMYVWFEDRTISLKNKILFKILVLVARVISLFTPKKISYPHIKCTAFK